MVFGFDVYAVGVFSPVLLFLLPVDFEFVHHVPEGQDWVWVAKVSDFVKQVDWIASMDIHAAYYKKQLPSIYFITGLGYVQ